MSIFFTQNLLFDIFLNQRKLLETFLIKFLQGTTSHIESGFCNVFLNVKGNNLSYFVFLLVIELFLRTRFYTFLYFSNWIVFLDGSIFDGLSSILNLLFRIILYLVDSLRGVFT